MACLYQLRRAEINQGLSKVGKNNIWNWTTCESYKAKAEEVSFTRILFQLLLWFALVFSINIS